MNKIYKRSGIIPSPPHLVESELRKDLGKDNFIFVGSSVDMFANDIDRNWISGVLSHCGVFYNKYLFQTRNAKRLYEFGFYGLFPKETCIAVTLETNRKSANALTKAPSVDERFSVLNEYKLKKLIISIEPVMDFDINDFIEIIGRLEPIQVNIGADTGHNNLPEPPKEKIIDFITVLKTFTKVVEKKNLRRLIG
jgi:DNA repair photolyase